MTRPLDEQGSSTRPYLIRALHDWCTDNGFTPYLAVHVDGSVQVPREYVKDNEIVLNVGFEATSGLEMGNEEISFKARFGGIPRDIRVPVDHVVAIYARENGQGMAFPMPAAAATSADAAASPGDAAEALHDASAENLPATPSDAAAGATHKGRAPLLAIVPTAEAAHNAPGADSGSGLETDAGPTDEPTPPEGGGRPALKRVK